MSVSVCFFASREMCFYIKRVPRGLSCSYLSWLGSVKRESEGVVMSHDVWRRLAKHPTGGGGLEESRNRTRVTDKKGRLKSHQLSGFSCVSMSTRQIGHFLLVASHWSTQPWWKRCMQGNLLEDRETRG